MGQATGCSGRYENHFDFQSVGLSFSFPALVTDKAKRVEHLEQCILVVVTGNFLHELRDAAPQGGIINSHERSDQPQAI